jgi:hypothetical protein
MKNNNFKLFFLLISIVTLNSCEQRGTIVLNNLKNDTTIFIPIKWITANPTCVIFNVTGNADDSCGINSHSFLVPKGKINLTLNQDWYDDDYFTFSYRKYKSKNTSLKVEYYIPGF